MKLLCYIKIIKLPMKGNLSECNNRRAISQQTITSKVFCRIILQHIITAVDKLLRQEQASLRKAKSCIDHIFVLVRSLNSHMNKTALVRGACGRLEVF